MPRMRVTSWFWNTRPRPGSATNTPIGSWSRVAASSCREWRSDWVRRARSSADEVASASARTYASCDSSNGCGEAKPSVRQPIARPSRTMGMLADARWPSAMNAGAKSGQRWRLRGEVPDEHLAAFADRLDRRDRRVERQDGRRGGRAAVALAREERGRCPVLAEHAHGAPLRPGARHGGPQQRPRDRLRLALAGDRGEGRGHARGPEAGERLGPDAAQGLAGEPAARLEERPVRVADHALPRPGEDDAAGRHLLDGHPDRGQGAAARPASLEAREACPDLRVGGEHEGLPRPADLRQRVVRVDRPVEALRRELAIPIAARADDVEMRAVGGHQRDRAAIRPERPEHRPEHGLCHVLPGHRGTEARGERLERPDVSRAAQLVGHLVQREHEAVRRSALGDERPCRCDERSLDVGRRSAPDAQLQLGREGRAGGNLRAGERRRRHRGRGAA